MAELTLRADASEAEIDDLWERLKAFSDTDQRETLSAWGKQVSGVSKVSSSTVSSEGSMASTVSVSASTAGAGVSHTSTVATSPVQNTYYTVDTTPRKIEPFSGASKVGGGEVDYAHWRRTANRIIEDGEISEGRKRNILLQSLSGVAEDAIDMYRDRSCQTIVEILDQIFGSTSDGHDLLADFYQIIQLPNQTTSEYLTQLYTRLCEVVKQEGILMREVPETLTRQFLRGTTDEEMLTKLRLEVDRPLDFPAFIAKVRREEARWTERRLRLRKVVRSNVSTASHSPTQSTMVTSPRESQRPLTMTMMRLLSSESELPCLKQAMLKLTSLHRRYRICKQKSNLASSVTAVVKMVMWHMTAIIHQTSLLLKRSTQQDMDADDP